MLLLAPLSTFRVDTIPDCLSDLGIKSNMHLVEIIIFDRSTCSKRSKESLHRRGHQLLFCRLLKSYSISSSYDLEQV